MRFLSKNFFYITLFLTIVILIYVLYKSEIALSGKKRDYYEIYYYFLTIFLIINLIILFLPYKIQIYFKITILSLLTSAYIFEGYINITGSLSTKEKKERLSKYKELTGKNYDTRTKIQIYKDLNKENNIYKLNILWTKLIDDKDKYDNIDLNKLKKFLPLSGVSNSKIIHCNENGYFSIYNSDRYGFNNPDDEWNKKTTKYLLIGDSFAHGACVNRPYDISSVLRQSLKEEEGVITLGQDETGPLIMYARLREYLPKNVENILWFYYEGNDYDDLNRELKIDILQNYLNNMVFDQKLIDRQDEVDLFSLKVFKSLNKDKKAVDQNKNNFSIIKFFKLFQTRMYFYRTLFIRELNQNPTKYLNQNFKKILTLANELAKENNSQLYFIHLPGGSRYASFINRYKKNDQFILEMLGELNIPYINLDKELFSKQVNPRDLFSFNQINIHYNKKGYKKVSETIHKFILENK